MILIGHPDQIAGIGTIDGMEVVADIACAWNAYWWTDEESWDKSGRDLKELLAMLGRGEIKKISWPSEYGFLP